MTQATRPLFQFDPGWLFIAAGLVVCAAGVLLPAQSDLDALRAQLDHLKSEENRAYARLKAHSDFMDQVDRADPALVRRLAAAQLNMIPRGDTPVLLVAAANSPVTDWIDATVKTDIRPEKPKAASLLSRLANGPHRLWLFGGGIMSVFLGLLLNPGPVRLWARSDKPADVGLDENHGLAIALQANDNRWCEDGFLNNSAADADAVDSIEVDPVETIDDDDLGVFRFARLSEAAVLAPEEAHVEEAISSEEFEASKSDVLLEPRVDQFIEVSALDILDQDLQDELNEIEQADDRPRQQRHESLEQTVAENGFQQDEQLQAIANDQEQTELAADDHAQDELR